MRASARTTLAVVAVGTVASQFGHAAAYALSYGGEAFQRQSEGSHAYFPGLLGLSLALSAAVVAMVMLLVGLARLSLARGTSAPAGPGWPLLRLIGALLLVQLAVYTAQELVESATSGGTRDALPTMLAAGLAGQLPAAVAAAVALRWLWSRLQQALQVLGNGRLMAPAPEPIAVETARRTRSGRGGTGVGTLAGWSERGPPPTSI